MLVNFSHAETEKFSAVLDLAEFGLNHAWGLSNDEQKANLYFIKKNSGAKFTPKQNKGYHVEYAESGQSKTNNTILHDSDNIPLLHNLIEQLNKIALITSHARESSSYSLPEFLKKLLEASDPLAINLGAEILYVDPEQHSFYYSVPLEQLNDYTISDVSPVVEVITAQDLSEFIKNTSLSPQPLTHLIWYTAFITSNGRLIDSLSEQDLFQLKDWPYLGAGSREYIKLATYLKTHRSNLADAIKGSDTPTEIANNFYNASHLAGLIANEQQTDIQAPPLPKGKLSFLDKIKNRLRH